MNPPRPWLSTVPRFQLFGFGHRRKLLYQSGTLRDALNGEILHAWPVRSESFEPSEYRVTLDTPDARIVLQEDESALWLHEHNNRRPLTESPVHLPDFASHPQAPLLRTLHAELLLNILPCGPLPNLWVYNRPWYRDSAMMALAFQKTNNLHLLEPWIEGLHQPYDYNNAGIPEPDNLGQALFLISLTSGRSHPLLPKILAAAKKASRNGHLLGKSDFVERPVYQTKWIKFGLQHLGLDHSEWHIPALPEDYSALFWMDFRDQHLPSPRSPLEFLHDYPYLHWAEAHFYATPAPESLSPQDFPLTREVKASEATYSRMKIVSPAFTQASFATPHTWHAAEAFLYYLDPRVSPQTS